jgi:hypothetical protein
MPNTGKLEKAKIVNAQTGATVVTCKFNPTQFGLSKGNNWSWQTVSDKNVGAAQFNGGNPIRFTLDLLFDTTDTGKDVRAEYTNKLLDLLKFKNNKPPPKVKLVWGKITTFRTYVAKVDQTFTFFKDDGTPLRVTAKVDFVQAVDENVFPAQNPTSRTSAHKLWVVSEGETLDWIAYQEYGDPTEWRHIANTNGIVDPRRLRPGQILNLTPLPV